MNSLPTTVIRGGTIVDGTGADMYEADILIAEGRIVEIGKCNVDADEVHDARGKLVMPGFVDVHTHYDAQATWASHITPSSCNGVTTVLMGNCGVGFAPVRPDQHEMLIELMEGVEDIPEVVLSEGLPWTWETFPDYLDALEARHYDVDVATQVPHAPLRVYVMGQRGANREPASDQDCRAMATLAGDAIRAGAFGFSTSRLLQHRTSSGAPVPSYGAAERELESIAMALAAVGRGWLQIVADFGDGQADEFAMFRRLVEQSGRPMTMTLLQRDAFPDEWRQLLARITEANRDGLSMTGQVRGRPTSTLLGFELSRNPFVDCPSWAEVVELGIDERIAVLSEPEFRSRIIAELSRSGASMDSSPNWKRIFRLGDPPQYEPEPELCVADQAERLGVSPAALAYDWMMEDGGRAILYHPTTNYTAGSMAPVFEMLRHDHTLIGLGDGGAHVGIMCDATDMAHAITHWTRDRSRGDRLPIEDIVRRLSSNNAEALGLTDRGRIALGMKADVNVIDYDRLRLRPPVVRYDLPAGGKRLLQQTDGFDLTMVSGVAVWRHGEATGQLPGRLLRSGDFS